jgi:hypothetical protein
MIEHQHAGRYAKRKLVFKACENFQILLPVPIIAKYHLTLIAPGNDVIQAPGYSTRARRAMRFRYQARAKITKITHDHFP